MRKSAFLLSLIALAAIVSCSAKVSPTAIIRVIHGEPPQAATGRDAVETEEQILTSYSFSQHLDEKLGLSKMWGMPADATVTKLRKAITVKEGKERGLFVITCAGLDHDLAVKILNELCAFHAAQPLELPGNTGQPQKVHVSIVQRAE